ncbi:MAG TPA: methylmalonyl Co-A mutase-associated GTPase MeaB [Candidatus Polarisedimenticolia bacterium]|nr:methylmalonyl Co-A mutase-associated GTPase MeaB [Candidatus Polarisedimenticolia bacterium]
MTGALLQRLTSGDPRALARSISLVEGETAEGRAILKAVYAKTGKALVLGITGPPGAGKSSLASKLVGAWRARGEKVGIIAVDPSSAFSGGAILGDRIRMQEHCLDSGVFIRSMATRGHFGGVSRACRDVVDLLDAAGYGVILIETVGVGQDEVEVVQIADLVLVVLPPGLGDDIQAIKAGILEIADLFVINKADREGADRLSSELQAMLALAPDEKTGSTPILRTVATTGQGVPELMEAVDRRRRRSDDAAARKEKERERSRERFLELLREGLYRRALEACLSQGEVESIAEHLARRECDPYTAAEEVLERIRFPRADRRKALNGRRR